MCLSSENASRREMNSSHQLNQSTISMEKKPHSVFIIFIYFVQIYITSLQWTKSITIHILASQSLACVPCTYSAVRLSIEKRIR